MAKMQKQEDVPTYIGSLYSSNYIYFLDSAICYLKKLFLKGRFAFLLIFCSFCSFIKCYIPFAKGKISFVRKDQSLRSTTCLRSQGKCKCHLYVSLNWFSFTNIKSNELEGLFWQRLCGILMFTNIKYKQIGIPVVSLV